MLMRRSKHDGHVWLQLPKQRVHLAVGLPTPIHPWRVPGLPEDINLWIKRDDLTGAALHLIVAIWAHLVRCTRRIEPEV